jgi:tRNA 2-thiocytidine biosynthesis protein TtcA
MISDGDRIAVGLSGGKDSLALLWSFRERLSRIPIHYSFVAIHVDLGFKDSPWPSLEAYCLENDYPVRVAHTDYGIRAHSEENKENPCFLCARLRRKRLFEMADELQCNKLALGHTMDDIIETLFLNMCYSGEIATMVPRQPFFGGKLEVIRPLAHVEGKALEQFVKDQAFPFFPNPCPSAKTSKRSDIKIMLAGLYETNKKIKGNLFRSMSHVNREYLLKPGKRSPKKKRGRS